MKAVLEEYGMIIIVVAIVLIFLLFATPLGKEITRVLEEMINNFLNKAAPGQNIPPIDTEGATQGTSLAMNMAGLM